MSRFVKLGIETIKVWSYNEGGVEAVVRAVLQGKCWSYGEDSVEAVIRAVLKLLKL